MLPGDGCTGVQCEHSMLVVHAVLLAGSIWPATKSAAAQHPQCAKQLALPDDLNEHHSK